MKILVVDDEMDVIDLYRQKFRKEIKRQGYEFTFAHSGQEALGILEGEDDDEDTLLILSDINMPGMSGLELLVKIKSTYNPEYLKVMMVSAYGDQENVSTAKNLGADDFLTKPVDFNKLKEKLKQI